MAFNPKFYQGATSNQIRNALNYSAYLITPQQEKELKEEKAVQPQIETDWKQVVETNEIVYPAGPVGVPLEEAYAQRITGTNLPN